MPRSSGKSKRQESPGSVDTAELVKVAASAAMEKKASDLVRLDLRDVASFTEYFLIATGTSTRQVQAICDAIEQALRQRGKRPLHIEGYGNAEWVLLDYGDFIVHVFTAASRKFYDLERLWRDAGRLEIKEEGS
jgi:ribosome-associated protein